MQIRPFQPEDAERLGTIFYRSVRYGALGAYSQSQVEAWAPVIPPAILYERKAQDGRILLVALDDAGEPVAYGDLEPSGHIDHLFCLPEVIGKGVASALYDRLEAEGRGRDRERLFVDASEMARPLFEHKGFAVLERNDFILRGVLLHNYRMEKRLR